MCLAVFLSLDLLSEPATIFWLWAWYRGWILGAVKGENRRFEGKRKGFRLPLLSNLAVTDLVWHIHGMLHTILYLDEKTTGFISALLILVITYSYAVIVMLAFALQWRFFVALCYYSHYQLHCAFGLLKEKVGWYYIEFDANCIALQSSQVIYRKALHKAETQNGL